MLRKAIAGLAVAVCALMAAGTAAADDSEEIVGPYWNPHTRSYFGLVDSISNGRRWDQAAKAATEHWHRGVRGRLAIIPDRQTHDFVMEKFARRLNADTWFGLRYFCSFRKLMWIDGKVLEESPAGVWNPKWFRDDSATCDRSAGMDFMPVYYRNMGAFASWQASGEIKRFYDYLIEFPTGKP